MFQCCRAGTLRIREIAVDELPVMRPTKLGLIGGSMSVLLSTIGCDGSGDASKPIRRPEGAVE